MNSLIVALASSILTFSLAESSTHGTVLALLDVLAHDLSHGFLETRIVALKNDTHPLPQRVE